MRWTWVLVALSTATAWAQPAEHGTAQRVSVPTVPAFEFRAGAPGTQGVREQMLIGEKGNEAKVSGYVVWMYSCVDDVRQAKETVAQAQKRIDDDPTLCERPKFYLADDPHTPVEQGLWVVDVARQWNRMEMERLNKKDRADRTAYPDRCDKNPTWKSGYCFPLAVGDYVTVTGIWETRSPHSEANSDGLIVFKNVVKASPPASIKLIAPTQRASTVKAQVVKRWNVATPTPQRRADSERLRAEARAAVAKQDFKKASEKYLASVQAWPGNQAASYELGSVEMALKDWLGAFAAFDGALGIQPDQPMYALMAGRAEYEFVTLRAKTQQANKVNKRVEEVILDATSVDFSPAESYFRLAVSLDAQLWRAHYYLGRIARDAVRVKEAATEFSLALQDGPSEGAPWIALCALYRKWGYADLAQRVAEQGAQIVVGDRDASDIYYLLGLTHDDQRHDVPALEAFDRALQLDANNMKARFQRGQVLYRLKRYAEAKADLDAYVASPAHEELPAQQATKMLMDIATKKPR
ncbi:MAG TPA: tetratricopeptide repeat protein [Kofleriaceae bacterium]